VYLCGKDAVVQPRVPVLLAAVNGAEAALCGPAGKDPPVRFGLSRGQVERLCRAALDSPPSRRRTPGARPAHRARTSCAAARRAGRATRPRRDPRGWNRAVQQPLPGLLRAGQGRRRFTLLVPDKLGQPDSRPYSHWAPIRASAYCGRIPTSSSGRCRTAAGRAEIAELEGSPTGGQA
jgi:hypothetical protein